MTKKEGMIMYCINCKDKDDCDCFTTRKMMSWHFSKMDYMFIAALVACDLTIRVTTSIAALIEDRFKS